METFNHDKMRNAEIEREVLSIVINNKMQWYKAVNYGLSKDCFYFDKHKFLYETMHQVLTDSEELNSTLVADKVRLIKEEAKNCGKLTDKFPTIAEIVSIAGTSITSTTLEAYVNRLIEYKITRETLDVAHSILNSEHFGYDLMNEAQTKLVSLTAKEEDMPKESLMDRLFESMEHRMTNPNSLDGMNCGFSAINQALGGMKGGHIGTIFARSGLGKTTFVTSILKNLIANGHKGMMFSLEMPDEDIAMKMLSNVSGVEFEYVKHPNLIADNEKVVKQLMNGMNWLHTKQHLFKIECDSDINTIISKAITEKLSHGLDFLIVDYLNIISGASGQHTDDIINKVTRALKQFSLKHKVHVIMLTQCNRITDSRQDKRPTVADLKDSSSIEQNSDYIIALYRNLDFDDQFKRFQLQQDGKIDYNSKDADFNPELLEANFLKNRYGQRLRVLLTWEGKYSRVRDRMYR